MLKQHARTIQLLQIATDAVVIASAFFLAVGIRVALQPFFAEPFQIDWGANLRLLACILPFWLILFYNNGLYGPKRRATLFLIAWPLAKSVAIGIIALAFGAFMLKIVDLSRSVVLIFSGLSFLGLLGARLGARWLLQILRRRGMNYRVIMIVGVGDRAREFVSILGEHRGWGIRIHGLINPDPADSREEVDGIPVIGRLTDVRRILDDEVVDEVCVFDLTGHSEELHQLISDCEEVGVETTIQFDPLHRGTARPVVYEWFGFQLLTYSRLPVRDLELVLKRVFDWLGALALVVLFSPVLAIIALTIKLSSKGAVIFTQTRVGRNGRQFTMYKFRSMAVDAESRREQLLDENEIDPRLTKVRKDPRVTRIGRILRRTSLDELPQLFNILKGEMSLVGPRPPQTKEFAEYRRAERRRLSMPPGLTGLWQVSGRSNLSFEESMELDLGYIDNWSLWLDFKILCKTGLAVVRGTGAY
ncbi:MAG: exopolysaccharide biosynthesis polyprenyl glycosylphosphotransferase [Verrucomicrobiales bacterium]|jgi:exopolysaccharide biosynthesis polyprenyl glycosylphosphotransferase